MADYYGNFNIIYNMEDGTTQILMVDREPSYPPGRFPAEDDFSLETNDDVKSIQFPIIITDGLKKNRYQITFVKE